MLHGTIVVDSVALLHECIGQPCYIGTIVVDSVTTNA